MEWRVLRVAVPPATAGPLADFLLAEGAPGVVREVEGMTPDRVVVEAHVPASTHARVALARLGVPHVVALDVDPEVLPRARANLDRNGARDVHLVCGRADACRGRFDLVVANLLADALVQDAVALTAVTAREGHLVVSGLLDTQVETVTAAFPAWRTVVVRAEDHWRTLTLARAA